MSTDITFNFLSTDLQRLREIVCSWRAPQRTHRQVHRCDCNKMKQPAAVCNEM